MISKLSVCISLCTLYMIYPSWLSLSFFSVVAPFCMSTILFNEASTLLWQPTLSIKRTGFSLVLRREQVPLLAWTKRAVDWENSQNFPLCMWTERAVKWYHCVCGHREQSNGTFVYVDTEGSRMIPLCRKSSWMIQLDTRMIMEHYLCRHVIGSSISFTLYEVGMHKVFFLMTYVFLRWLCNQPLLVETPSKSIFCIVTSSQYLTNME